LVFLLETDAKGDLPDIQQVPRQKTIFYYSQWISLAEEQKKEGV
jgi:hypothetical protein